MGMSAFYLAGRARLEVFTLSSIAVVRPGRACIWQGERPLCTSERGLADGALGWCPLAAIRGRDGKADLTWSAVGIVWLRGHGPGSGPAGGGR